MNEAHDIFTRAYERLNGGQKKAVDTIEGPVVVMAGPGTGKTQVLTLRIANILKKTDIPPDAILALTYTNSGVASMRERLRTFIGNDAYRVHISTFHGYASSVIESHPDAFPRIIGARAADDVDLYDIVRAAIVNVGAESLRPPGNPEYYIKPILHLIGALKSDRVGVDEYSTYIKTLDGEEGAHTEEGEASTKLLRSEAFLEVFKKYEALMRERNLYDYSDMLVELIHALETNTDIRLELSESAQYILADEHQDANRSQNRILELLSDYHESPNLFIVGDDKQAIYRFQGASLENFLYFKHKYSDGVVIPLTENYRSKEEVLTAAYSLMKGRSAEDIELEATQGTGGAVSVLVAPTEDEEVAVITERIAALVSAGTPPCDIAVLVRKNKDIDTFIRSLKAKRIPYTSFRDTDALASSEVLLLIALIRASVQPHNDIALARALFLPAFGLSASVLSKLFHTHERAHRSLYEVLGGDITLTAQVFFDTMVKRARTKGAVEAFDFLVSESGFLSELLSADELTLALEAYRKVRLLIEGRAERHHEYTLADTLPLFDDLMNGVAALPLPRRANGEGVQLMSLHKSKGLEFDYVFVPHALESRFKPRTERSLFFVPPYVNTPETTIDDERRLFYVGLTRARVQVCISRHEKRSDDKEEMPLSFLAELFGATEEKVLALREVVVTPQKRTADEARKEYDVIISEFLEHGISATALNVYLRDPWECFFNSIIKLPRTKEPSQLYGTAMHTALERFFTQLKEEGVKDKTYLVSAFKTALSHAGLSPKDYVAYLKKGTTSLGEYFDAYEASFFANVDTEIAVKAEVLLPAPSERGRVVVHGFLDKLEHTSDGVVRVVDYKTGSPKSRNHIEGKTKDSNGDYKRQLVFYKLLLEREGKYRMEEAVIDFVEPTDSGKHKREAFSITDEEVQELTAQIAAMADDLVRGDFLTKTSASEDAEVRALALLMQKRFSL